MDIDSVPGNVISDSVDLDPVFCINGSIIVHKGYDISFHRIAKHIIFVCYEMSSIPPIWVLRMKWLELTLTAVILLLHSVCILSQAPLDHFWRCAYVMFSNFPTCHKLHTFNFSNELERSFSYFDQGRLSITPSAPWAINWWSCFTIPS